MNKLIPLALGAAIVIGGGTFLATNSATSTTAISPVTPAVAQDANVELAPDMTIGAEDAPVTLVEYASFTCPHCSDFHDRVWDKLKAEYIDTGKVKFVHREVYFDKFGLWAGLVARCGGDMRYFGIVDMLYSTQDDWIGGGDTATILDNLKTIGKKAGMTDGELQACLEDESMAQSMVAAYQKHAADDGIKGTPTLVINGDTHSNMTYKDLKEVLDGYLEG